MSKSSVLPSIFLDLSSFATDEKQKEIEFKIKKKLIYKNHRFVLKKPIISRVKIQKITRNLLIANFDVSTEILLHCDRCLKPFIKNLKLKFTREIKIKPQEEDIELTPNNRVEIIEPIWQEIVLKVPARILCQKNCLGICPVCGTNWNQKKCAHKNKVLLKNKKSSPFEMLKKLKYKKHRIKKKQD